MYILLHIKKQAMYKTRNTGTGNGMRGTRGIVGMLYFGECCQTFRGMSSKNPEKIRKQSVASCKTFFGKYERFQMNVHNSTRYW